MTLRFRVAPFRLAVCRLAAEDAVPAWGSAGAWHSITRTPSELSIVCEESNVPAGVRHQGGWAALMLEGPFEFALTGVLASVAGPLAAAGVPIFAVSTFDTDWVLVPQEKLDAAVHALKAAGHTEVAQR